MSNQLVEAYRRDLASRGQVDPRDDDSLTIELGHAAEQNNRDLFDQYGDFASEYRALREANAPSLAGEAGAALKSGTQGLASTALGGLGLVTGSDYLKNKARLFDEDAAANAPTIGTLEDIAPGETTAGKVFSRDALRYGIAKVGSVAPSIAESVVTAGAGALAGSAMAPGPGTLVGAAGGVLEKSLVKAAIRKIIEKGVAEEMVAKGLIKDATEVGIEQALKAGSKSVATEVSAEAAAIGSFRGGVAANAAGSFLLNAGDVASEGASTPVTLALGVVSALPDTIIPAYVLKKLFPGVAKTAAKEAGKTWLARNGVKLAELAGVPAEEFGQEYFQEAINVVARNIKDDKDPLTFDDADLRRLREAGIAGAAGGLLAAPGVMLSGHGGAGETTPRLTAETQRRAMAERALAGEDTTPLPPTAPSPVPVAPVAPVVPPSRRVALMTDEQKAARLAELSAQPNLAPAEQQELELLRAIIGSEPAAAAPIIPPAPPVAAPISPAAADATGVEPQPNAAETSASAAANSGQNGFLAPAPVGLAEDSSGTRRLLGGVFAETAKDPYAIDDRDQLTAAIQKKFPDATVSRVYRDENNARSLTLRDSADGMVNPMKYWKVETSGLTFVLPYASGDQFLETAPVFNHEDSKGTLRDFRAISPAIAVPSGAGAWTVSDIGRIASHGDLGETSTASSHLVAPAPVAVSDVTPNAVTGAAPLVQETAQVEQVTAPVVAPVANALADRPVKIQARRAQTGEMMEVEMPAAKAEKMLSSRADVLRKLIDCLKA